MSILVSITVIAYVILQIFERSEKSKGLPE